VSIAVVRRLLRARLAAGCDAAGIPPTHRQWQGAAFATPDPIALHVRETLLPGAERVVTIARGAASAETIGLYQVDVFAPADRGTADVDAAVEAIRAEFVPGGQRVEDGWWLWIEAASPLAITETDRTLQCPLSITWRARRALPGA
jgi:hypothetical protein